MLDQSEKSQQGWSLKPLVLHRYGICRNLLSLYTNFNVSGKYNSYIDKEALSDALARLIRQHPYFYSNFYRVGDKSNDKIKGGSNFVLKPLEEIKFDDIVEYWHTEDFDEKSLEKLDKIKFGLNCSKPLWKVVVHELPEKKQVITACFDHALFDGSSAKHFHVDLLRFLGDQEAPEYRDAVFSLDEMSLEAPFRLDLNISEELYHPPLWFVILRTLKHWLVPDILSKVISSFFCRDSPNTFKYPCLELGKAKRDPQTAFKMINIKPDTLSDLVKFCKSNGFTLTPLLTTLSIAALTDAINATITPQSFSTKCICDLNGRRFLPDTLESSTKYGMFVSASFHTLGPIAYRSCIDLIVPSKILHRQIQKSISSKFYFYMFGLLRYLNCWDFLYKKLDTPRADLYELSNLGIVKATHRNWTLDDMWFSQNIGILQQVTMSVIATPRGGLNVTMSFFADLVNECLEEGSDFVGIFTTRFNSLVLNVVDYQNASF